MKIKLLLQGDPQTIKKQRVETAIRVIIDLLLQIPASLSVPPAHPFPSSLPYDEQGNTYSLRLDTFRALKLQAGTTTKNQSKKCLQNIPTPIEQVAYLETAVHMSGVENDGRRVYVCKRCRNRETRRKEHKDLNRKKHSNSGSSSSSNPKPSDPLSDPKLPESTTALPSPDRVTGQNPDQYDPHRASQVVDPPPWDPSVPDWRHDIILFNSMPELAMSDGSCACLPFRVVCYGKCHGEKTGFRQVFCSRQFQTTLISGSIRFTLRAFDGTVIASSETDPIKITDDHKTDVKVKSLIESMTSAQKQPVVPKTRRGGQSAASSRRQSPINSEAELVQPVAEVGAMSQRQTPQARLGKPYERPLPESPVRGALFEDTQRVFQDRPHYPQQHSRSSMHTSASMSALPIQGEGFPIPVASAEYPVFEQTYPFGHYSTGAFMSPHNGSYPLLNGTTSMPSSAAHSTTSSNFASPIISFAPLGQDDLVMSGQQHRSRFESSQGLQFTTPLHVARQQHDQDRQQHRQQQQQQRPVQQHLQHQYQTREQMMFGSRSNQVDVEMANALSENFGDTLYSSSGVSLTSGYTDGFSASSTGFPEGSIFSNSGLVPRSSSSEPVCMTDFLDYTGGQGPNLVRPPYFHDSSGPVEPNLSPMAPPLPVTEPLTNVPIIMTVIPSEGPMAGGTTVAVIGDNFSPELVILFGDRTAKLLHVSSTVIQCLSPPAPVANSVEVSIQGVPLSPLNLPKRNCFRYNMLDSDMWVIRLVQNSSLISCRMRLALQVRDEYQGSSSDAVYRLAQHVAGQSHSTNEWSGRSNSSPSNSNSSTHDADISKNDSHLRYKRDLLHAPPHDVHRHNDGPALKASPDAPTGDLETTILAFLASIDQNAPGSLRRSGAINCRNGARQTILHLASVMGFYRLLSRLVLIGAHLDLQDLNGYTALSLASLCGEVSCARLLIDAGASYDRPTAFGEMPLDLAKAGCNPDIEMLLLSAVWSTVPEYPSDDFTAEASMMAGIGIEYGSSSSGSDDDRSSVVPSLRRRNSRGKRTRRPTGLTTSPRSIQRSCSSTTVQATPSVPPIPLDDEPPPYDRRDDTASWMSRTLSNIPHPPDILPGVAWARLPGAAIFAPQASGDHGWIQFPASTWEKLHKITSAEDVKLITQAMAAAVFNAVVQTGSTTTSFPEPPAQPSSNHTDQSANLSSDSDQSSSSRSVQRMYDSDDDSPARKMVRPDKSEFRRISCR